MTAIPESLEPAISAFAERENVTNEKAVERLIGYGLNAVAENDRLNESLEPHHYRVEEGASTTDASGDPVLSEWTYMFSATTMDRARAELTEFATGDLDETARVGAERNIHNAMLDEVIRIGSTFWRITKTS